MRAETQWPGGRKVAALVTVALELWVRRALARLRADGRRVAAVRHRRHAQHSWADYGVTTGIRRLLDVLGHLPATVSVKGSTP